MPSDESDPESDDESKSESNGTANDTGGAGPSSAQPRRARSEVQPTAGYRRTIGDLPSLDPQLAAEIVAEADRKRSALGKRPVRQPAPKGSAAVAAKEAARPGAPPIVSVVKDGFGAAPPPKKRVRRTKSPAQAGRIVEHFNRVQRALGCLFWAASAGNIDFQRVGALPDGQLQMRTA